MKVHIKVVIATAGNDEEYVGKHLGMKLLGRPLSSTVVTFEEEVTDDEYQKLIDIATRETHVTSICRSLFINQAIKVHSFSVTRNINN